MLYEMRSYWIESGEVDAYLDWANNRALPVLQGEFGFRLVGFWRVRDVEGPAGEDHPNVVWLLAWRDREERDRKWEAARASASWAKINEGRPRFHRRPGSMRFLEGIPRSPLQ